MTTDQIVIGSSLPCINSFFNQLYVRCNDIRIIYRVFWFTSRFTHAVKLQFAGVYHAQCCELVFNVTHRVCVSVLCTMNCDHWMCCRVGIRYIENLIVYYLEDYELMKKYRVYFSLTSNPREYNIITTFSCRCYGIGIWTLSYVLGRYIVFILSKTNIRKTKAEKSNLLLGRLKTI